MPDTQAPPEDDVAAIGRLPAVPAILDVVCRTTGMGFAAVARVTGDRWIACSVLDNIDFGLRPGGELKVETTICNEIQGHRAPVVIDDVAGNPAWCGHPTPAMYGFQSYISVPITRRDGRFFGTLCAIDPRPARLENPGTIGMFTLFAQLIAAHLDAEDDLRRTREELSEQRTLSELREQFIAVLGHDLRNPVASVGSGVRLLRRSVSDAPGREILALMQASVLRIGGLIGNLMDFARARLGDGLALDVTADRPLAPALEQVVAELRAAHPGRMLEAAFDLDEPVAVDHGRVAQLLSNLLANAVTHGAPDRPVRIGATARDGAFALWVSNAGTPIPPEALPGLFQPFFRGSRKGGRQGEGLGLGLYIAAEIARVHGGALDVASDAAETRFTFRMPAPG